MAPMILLFSLKLQFKKLLKFKNEKILLILFLYPIHFTCRKINFTHQSPHLGRKRLEKSQAK